MRAAAYFGLGIVSAVTLAAVGVAGFIGSGAYDIGADDHHTMFVTAIIEELRERSISSRADAIEVPRLEDPTMVAAGAAHYATLCIGCHLAPGITKSTLRAGLYPHAPNLAQEDRVDARKAFWTVKHGVKMSAMPAWGKSLDDATIWQIVAFVRQLSTMSPETYQQLSTHRVE
ncbi:MAG: cytochrome c [Steroidobacteraceae bacterium]|jgi:mono/diheme cytochrome c family protein